jgi:hypothetical protein
MSSVIVEGNISGTGSVTIAAPNTNSDYTLTLPDNTGTILTNATTTGFPAGSVLQVVSTFKDNVFSSSLSPGTFVDVTGFSASITPKSSSNKVLIVVSFNLNGGTLAGTAKLLRDSTLISNGVTAGNRTSASIIAVSSAGDLNRGVPASIVFFDSPATTSSVTYKLQIGNIEGTTTGTFYFNTSGADANFSYIARSGSSITLMEIAA